MYVRANINDFGVIPPSVELMKHAPTTTTTTTTTTVSALDTAEMNGFGARKLIFEREEEEEEDDDDDDDDDQYIITEQKETCMAGVRCLNRGWCCCWCRGVRLGKRDSLKIGRRGRAGEWDCPWERTLSGVAGCRFERPRDESVCAEKGERIRSNSSSRRRSSTDVLSSRGGPFSLAINCYRKAVRVWAFNLAKRSWHAAVDKHQTSLRRRRRRRRRWKWAESD